MSDEMLVRFILDGDKRLFEQLIRRYNQRLYRLGMTLLGDAAEAEDAMQAAYIKAYEHLERFEQRSSFGTWLTRIMINECLQRKRRQELRRGHVISPFTMNSPDHILANKELNALLEEAIARLPEKYRTVFVLREIEDMSVRETGEALEIGEANVKVRLNRAKVMLREYLGGYMRDRVFGFHLSRCDLMVQRVFAALEVVS